jgi:hypothetical protein
MQLLIDPGVGTVPKRPGVGPSKGQVPQVTLDEQLESYSNNERECRNHLQGFPKRRNVPPDPAFWVTLVI